MIMYLFFKVRLQMIQKHNFRILKVQMHIYIYHFCKYISMYVSKYRHQFFIIKSNFWYLHKANWFKESLITFNKKENACNEFLEFGNSCNIFLFKWRQLTVHMWKSMSATLICLQTSINFNYILLFLASCCLYCTLKLLPGYDKTSSVSLWFDDFFCFDRCFVYFSASLLSVTSRLFQNQVLVTCWDLARFFFSYIIIIFVLFFCCLLWF